MFLSIVPWKSVKQPQKTFPKEGRKEREREKKKKLSIPELAATKNVGCGEKRNNFYFSPIANGKKRETNWAKLAISVKRKEAKKKKMFEKKWNYFSGKNIFFPEKSGTIATVK